MKTLSIRTNAKSEFVDISSDIEKLLPSGFTGICQLFCLHTTAALTVNENADPDVKTDMIKALDRIVPWDDPQYRHFEGNSAAHLKASLMGFSLSLPIENGRLALGQWQGVYLCEFDGPRTRKVSVMFLKESGLEI